MADQIETFYRTGYVEFIRLNAMSVQGRLEGTTDFEQLRGEPLRLDSYGEPNVGIAPDVLVEILTRNDPNTIDEMPRFARTLAARWWEFTERFSRQDPLRTIRAAEPGGQFSQSVLAAFSTQADILIITAFDADAAEEDGTPIVFDAANTIDETVGADNMLNPDRIIRGYFRLIENQVPTSARWYGAMHPIQATQLMGRASDNRVTSSDFRTQMAPLETGQPGFFMGTEWRVTPDIPTVTNIFATTDGKFAYMYSQDGIVFGKSGEIEMRFDILAHIRHSLQAAHYRTMSATRMHETHVVRLINDNLLP